MNRHSVPLLIALIAATTTANAQPRTKADERFEQGRKLMEAGKYDEACTAFEDSQQLDPAVTTLLNLGACREKAGELASAVEVFRAAVRSAQQDGTAKSKELGDIAAGHVKRLEPRVSSLTIMVAREQRVDGLTIERNGVRVDQRQWDLPLQLDGGSYEIVARAPGHESWSTKVKIAREGDAKTIYLPDLHPSTDKAGDPRKNGGDGDGKGKGNGAGNGDSGGGNGDGGDGEEDSGDHHSLILPISLGVAALVAGGVAIWSLGRGDDLYAQSKVEPDPDRQDSLWHSANTYKYTAEGLAVAGVGLAAVSIWLFVRGNSDSKSSSTALTPAASSDGASITFSGRF